MSPSAVPQFHVKKIAIIGAGPSGLSAAKYLRAQNSFDSIVIFEQQRVTGGIWNFSKHSLESTTTPKDDRLKLMNNFIGDSSSTLSPIYDQLYANIPVPMMQFSDQHFPQGTLLFPSRETIQGYLLTYAQEVMGLIKFGVEVKQLEPLCEGTRTTWALEAISAHDNQIIRDTYDAVVVATGHYSVPFIPDVKNIKKFMEAYPSVISHSRDYRSRTSFKDKKTIVVGNGASGTDIALQINRVSHQKTMVSVRSPTPQPRLAYMACEEVPEIEEFLVHQRGIRFKDGRIETEIDAVIFCTGFLYDYPFLRDLNEKLITTGGGVHGLYKHIFCIDHPTLVFPALNVKTAPWPLSEAQAAVFSAVWSNNIQLPSKAEMQEWAKKLYEDEGEQLHIFRTSSSDGVYINELYDWVMKSHHKGKQPPFCNDTSFWQKHIFPQAKLKFEKDGYKATSLEELGFFYEEDWRTKV
ncbi:FAD/NAD(P)-binding domain-containing protein [Trichoderma camerunense]